MTTPTPYYSDARGIELYLGDCREIIPALPRLALEVDATITDPPYGDTHLAWDASPVEGWQQHTDSLGAQIWCFGSMRFHLGQREAFTAAGWRYGQEVVWEKHNGSGFAVDRFKRVHEIAVHWYRGKWRALHTDVPRTSSDVRKRGTRRSQPAHLGASRTTSYDSSSRLMRSVLHVRSEHGRAVHPTQKPLGVLDPLIRYSVPLRGLVLDPFAGSGSTLLAARLAGRRAVGIELDERYAEAAAQRLAQGDLLDGLLDEAVA